MKIEHTALYVLDLEATKDFFVKFFGAKVGNRYHNPRTNFESYFLSFEDGARLEIMTRPNLKEGFKADELVTGWAHLAFSTGSKEEVDTLTIKLLSAGYKVLSGPRTTGDGYYESAVEGPDGYIIEITV